MPIRVRCPACPHTFLLTIAQASGAILCPACGKVIRDTRPDAQGEYALLAVPRAAEVPALAAEATTSHRKARRRPLPNYVIPLIGVILFLLAVLLAAWAYRAAVQQRQQQQTPPARIGSDRTGTVDGDNERR